MKFRWHPGGFTLGLGAGAIALSLLTACGSWAGDAPFGDGVAPYTPQDRSGGDAGDAGDASYAADAGDGGDSAPSACPALPPSQGDTCADEDRFCAWGSDPRYACRTVAACRNQTWQLLTTGSCPAPPPACPASAPPLRSGGVLNPPCAQEELGLTCVYGGTAFTCTVCNGSLCFARNDEPAYQWFATTLQAGCSDGPLPNFGDPCDRPGLACDYNQCANTDFLPEVPRWGKGVGLICQEPAWTDWNLDNGAPECL